MRYNSSQIGAYGSKKKKHGDYKKPAKSPEQRLLNFINEEKTRINSLVKKTNMNYPSSEYKCSHVANIIGVSTLEVIRAAIVLCHKDLVSWPKGRNKEKYFTIYGIDYRPNRKTIETLKIHFKLNVRGDKCPVCESNMPNSYFSAIEKIPSSTCEFKCPNGCFSYYGHVSSADHLVTVFDKKFSISNKAHKSIRNTEIVNIKREIDKMKKDYRYLAEILERK